ncbi:phosphate ABC transporter substrate-binding protein PstS [Clavibacter tessellarius]|uniref:Phosphate-binding protein n=1 Tax=Clavibacter tessellarius TaxID=31965 RepID=A0A225CLL4_9MICO|nr:phosphate ABC transporter substrate-binding protein PstS [Clavibacter michiganensis]OQJ63276.1 phosphate ABC transporter substrate-binding protein PstS [Clavibacter michiganensis subsp. tessellarius]UKF33744.1 phosphate ABC transporter substrate-binding protein PstS [Clavibacter michiganensis subsp. tessellarius]
MNSTRLTGAAALAAAVALALSSCASNEAPAEGGAASGSTLEGTLNGIGASSQGSAQEAWTKAFQTANTGVTINYSPDGSGAGREAFMAGGQNANFAGSDRALKTDELTGTFGQCADGTKPIDIPAYISPIAMIFQIDGVDELNLDPATAAGIFKGTITKWDDPAITALNPDATMPDAAITAVHRSDDSGTTENFAKYLNTTAESVWDAEPKGVWPYEGGEAAQGTSGVVDAVTGGTNVIGYADASRAGDLGVAKIKVGDEFVGFSPEAAAAVVEASPEAEGREENDVVFDLDYTTDAAGVYPIVLVSYLISCQEYEDPAVGELVKAYLGYVTSTEGQQVAADEAGAAPLSETVAAQVKTAVESIK